MTLQTFAVGLIGLIVGLVFGIFLGYGVTFETIHIVMAKEAAYGWASAVGSTGAVFVAILISVIQNKKTNEMWQRSVENENKNRKIANIGDAYEVKGIILTVNTFAKSAIFALENKIIPIITVHEAVEQFIASKLNLLSDRSRKAPECHEDVIRGSNHISCALMIFENHHKAQTGEDVEALYILELKMAIESFNKASATIDREYYDLFSTPHHSPSNNGTSAAG